MPTAPLRFAAFFSLIALTAGMAAWASAKGLRNSPQATELIYRGVCVALPQGLVDDFAGRAAFGDRPSSGPVEDHLTAAMFRQGLDGGLAGAFMVNFGPCP